MREVQRRAPGCRFNLPVEGSPGPFGMIAATGHGDRSIGFEPVEVHAKRHAPVIEAELGLAADFCCDDRVSSPPAAITVLGRDGGVYLLRRGIDGNEVAQGGHSRVLSLLWVDELSQAA